MNALHKTTWMATFIMLGGMATGSHAVQLNLSHTQTDATTGSGTVSGGVALYAPSGPTTLSFSGPVGAGAVTQQDTIVIPVPATAVGGINSNSSANPGAPNGVHIDLSGTATVTAVAADTYTLSVPLTIRSGDPFSYSIDLFDDNSGAGGSNDNTSTHQIAGWIGDIGGGHRQTDGNQVFGAGADTLTASASTNLGSHANGDSAGITAAKRSGSGTIFVDEVDFDVRVHGDSDSLLVNGQPGLSNTNPFSVVVDFGNNGQDVQAGHIEVSQGGDNVDLNPGFLDVGTGIIGIALDDTNQSGSDVGGLDWRDRGNSANSGNDLVNLGEDLVKNNAGIIRLTLTGLLQGDYTMTSYHGDPGFSQSESIEVVVNTGAGFVSTLLFGDASMNHAIGTLDTAEVQQGSVTFSFSADGVNPVQIVWDGTGASDTEVPLNGFSLDFAGTELDLVPEPATILIAALGLLGMGWLGWRRRKRA